jgi:hypothetical protein
MMPQNRIDDISPATPEAAVQVIVEQSFGGCVDGPTDNYVRVVGIS